MKVTVFTSSTGSAHVRSTIERIVRLGLTRFGDQLRHVQVSVRDQNGPKGGDDQRCVLRITPNGLPEIVIQEVCPSVEQAVGLAVDRAARNVGRVLDRRLRNREYQHRRRENESAANGRREAEGPVRPSTRPEATWRDATSPREASS